MRIKSAIAYVFLTILLISVAAIIDAKSGGRISGQVVDNDTGDPVRGATVMIVGTKQTTTTGSDGKFTFGSLDPGAYTLKITHPNYKTLIMKAVTVRADLRTDASCRLERAGTEVRADSSVVFEPPVVVHDQNLGTEGKVQEMCMMSVTPPGVARKSAPAQMCGKGRESYYYPPAHGGNAIVNGEAFDAMFFKNYGVNPFVDTEDDHLSTFAIDVDDASYIMMRSYLDRGALPPNEAIRTEEFVNHFKYNYPAPGEETFRIFFEGSPSKFGQNCQMLKIGIKGLEIASENRKAANLVFVVDVSGSMGREDRLGLVRKALRLLVDELTVNDRVGIVVYGSSGQVILEPTSIKEKDKIISAIEKLYPSGSTNAEEGIRLGYKMADKHFEKGKINRIILCSDGVANVGRTGPDDILKMIKQYADKGITLSSIGFGMGNYNDILLEKLGNKGNGHYAYVDNIGEAKRIFVENLTGNLQVIARDVKIQVDFNPEVVRSYRLLGYENRDVDDDKFRDDKEDGGEVGSGHEVTALYEVKFKESPTSERVGTIFVRYKDPDDMEQVTEINQEIRRQDFRGSFAECSHEYRLAACAAEFSEILRKSYWAKGSKLDDVLQLAKDLVYENESQELIELMGLISKAQNFEEQLAQK
ncbi:MAG: von Willebrand factor type A domain-containing protein [Candidatus Zixiibacteriota bacterium]|nr:MAG: von Willebrand factor type A domain-containing protein [candidate division Zixibacteria bacterium]